jgi:hypothetical protein
MNHISVFLNTKVQNTGWLSAVGNFFLAPTRFLFSGKTINIERDSNTGLLKPRGQLAKVSSFFAPQTAEFEPSYQKFSKQDPQLESTSWGYGVNILFLPIIMAALFIPFAVIGSIFKAFSYLNPQVREAHHTVKERLTPTDKAIGDENKPVNQTELEKILHDFLMSGQKINALIIHAKAEQMSEGCLRLIKKLNPSKVVLVGDWNKNNFNIKPYLTDSSTRPRDKSSKWDLSAIEEPVKPMQNVFDYKTPVRAENIVPSIARALSSRQSFFGCKHTVYVVNAQDATEDLTTNSTQTLGL